MHTHTVVLTRADISLIGYLRYNNIHGACKNAIKSSDIWARDISSHRWYISDIAGEYKAQQREKLWSGWKHEEIKFYCFIRSLRQFNAESK